ncbi:Uncharacterised protein [Bordetella ansorpii]|uniref:Uncharacterized protein n=1 Tax=Bordetella ansorpii TaxID=288768 RepID=A0A157PNW7_9BORD|nr:hypothetical protein [Bordetella ansorpii]SAI35237.1 Uncharacterised protein [Bordetella ansorpii]
MRGTILRGTDQGDGLIAADGRQYPFTLEAHWRGARAPAVNQTVQLAFAGNGGLESVTPIETKQLAGEQARQALEQGRQWLSAGQDQGGKLARQITARVGLPDLVAMGLLALASTVFSTLDMRVMGVASGSLSLYSVLGLAVNGPGAMGAGGAQGPGMLTSILWLLAVFGPLLAYFLRSPKARRAYFLPLVLWAGLLLAIVRTVWVMRDAMQAMRSFTGSNAAFEKMMPNLGAMVWESASFGLGFYLSLAITLYFVYRGASILRAGSL